MTADAREEASVEGGKFVCVGFIIGVLITVIIFMSMFPAQVIGTGAMIYNCQLHIPRSRECILIAVPDDWPFNKNRWSKP